MPVFVDWTETELVEVCAHIPAIADAFIVVTNAVFVFIDELGEFLFLEDVDLVIDYLQPEWFLDACGEFSDAHLGFVLVILDEVN